MQVSKVNKPLAWNEIWQKLTAANIAWKCLYYTAVDKTGEIFYLTYGVNVAQKGKSLDKFNYRWQEITRMLLLLERQTWLEVAIGSPHLCFKFSKTFLPVLSHTPLHWQYIIGKLWTFPPTLDIIKIRHIHIKRQKMYEQYIYEPLPLKIYSWIQLDHTTRYVDMNHLESTDQIESNRITKKKGPSLLWYEFN